MPKVEQSINKLPTSLSEIKLMTLLIGLGFGNASLVEPIPLKRDELKKNLNSEEGQLNLAGAFFLVFITLDFGR